MAMFFSLIFSFDFLFEFIIIAVHPIPYDNEYTFHIIDMLSTKSQLIPVHYKLSDFLLAFMFFRLYFLVRTLFNFTIYSDLYSKRICTKYEFEANTHFYIKAIYSKRPGLIILIVLLITITYYSYVLRIFER